MEDEIQTPGVRAAMWLGCAVALIGTTVFWWPGVASNIFPDEFTARNLAAQAADWAFVLILVLIIFVGERRGLSSLRFGPLNATTFFTGLGLGGFVMVGIVLWRLGTEQFFPSAAGGDAGEELPLSFVLWYAPLALITASVAEEIIFRGYAMERLLQLRIPPWLVVVLTQIAFALYHMKDGYGAVAMVAVVGSLFAIYYLMTRNLTVTIIGHFFVDAMAILGELVGVG